MKQPTFQFIIDLDERGIFKCHVENKESGKSVWETSNEDEDGNSSPFWMVEDGFIKNCRDMEGLRDYLRGIVVIPFHSNIEYVG